MFRFAASRWGRRAGRFGLPVLFAGLVFAAWWMLFHYGGRGMFGAGTAEWVRWVGAAGLLILLAGLVFVSWWALFADRSRGRRRCPRCWYDLSYSPGMTCAECGFTGRSERDFQRTHRRWWIAVVSILAGALLGGYAIDFGNQRGWMSYFPTQTLIWMLPSGGAIHDATVNELVRRMHSRSFDEEQYFPILERCAVGDGGSRPPSDEWASKYVQLLTFCRSALGSSDDEEVVDRLNAILLDVSPRVTVTTRGTWPAGVQPTLDVAVRDWPPRGTPVKVRAVLKRPAGEPATHLRWREPIQPRSYSLFLPVLDPGRHDVEIEFFFDRGGPEWNWEPVGSQVVHLSVNVGGALDERLTAVDDEELNAAMTSALADGGLVKYGSGSLPVRVGIAYRRTYQRIFDDTAIGIRIDVLRNGKLARQLDIWWEGGDDVPGRTIAWEVPMLDDELLGAPDGEDDVWTVRARGLPELALRVEGVSKYWAGEAEAEVGVQSSGAPAPSRGWVPASLSHRPVNPEDA